MPGSLKERAKVLSIYIGIVGATLGVATAWNELDWPRPALNTEVQAVRAESIEQYAGLDQFSRGTRIIVLNQELRQAKVDLLAARASLDREPGNRRLIEEAVRLEQLVNELNRQVRELQR
jgi:hypothetical protein